MSHGHENSAAAFTADGRWVITTSEDSIVRLWDAKTGRPITPEMALPAKGRAWTIAVSPGKRWAVLGGRMDSLPVLDLSQITAGSSRDVDGLCTWGEIVSGKHLVGGSSMALLTADEWLTRWRNYSGARPAFEPGAPGSPSSAPTAQQRRSQSSVVPVATPALPDRRARDAVVKPDTAARLAQALDDLRGQYASRHGDSDTNRYVVDLANDADWDPTRASPSERDLVLAAAHFTFEHPNPAHPDHPRRAKALLDKIDALRNPSTSPPAVPGLPATQPGVHAASDDAETLKSGVSKSSVGPHSDLGRRVP